jgi:hypothetical protein
MNNAGSEFDVPFSRVEEIRRNTPSKTPSKNPAPLLQAAI